MFLRKRQPSLVLPFLLLAAAGLSSACGQKGPLTLAPPAPAQPAATAAPAPAVPASSPVPAR